MSRNKDITVNSSLMKMKALFFCLFSLLLIFLDHRTAYLESIKYYLNGAVYPLQATAKTPGDVTRVVKSWFEDRSELIKQIEALENRELYLSFELQKMSTVIAENRRLRLLMRSSVNVEHPTTTAELLNITSDPYRHLIMLNQGERQEIHNNSPILNNSGIIGQIIEISPFSSKAILITDPHHSLPIEVNHNGVRGIASGNGKINQLDVTNIPYSDDLKVGDLLVTSGLDGIFPHGYPVATIDSIDIDSTGFFAKITATPTANLERIREVLVLQPQPPAERASSTLP
ncbi:rod shape-determining protein MreC [Ignatzschineria sp. RMDPL8A]|uniref:rod shape-determining protein MreC n=1 Tax=Ignatzschineria sp. RMDPL8A TaxID=2999236 RepID=UPI0024467063|nr:rod shape-determining protein MreC [Ignatzschineria sp. RMDPL8A]MDG9729888.1 rod shape-determining protein MreC [Ignatzschineria sp. RMDPL8A]